LSKNSSVPLSKSHDASLLSDCNSSLSSLESNSPALDRVRPMKPKR
jgi:hypothetical protein